MNTLIEQCRKGDRKGQHRFYELYANTVFRTCLRYIGNEAQAEDCVSETFLKIFTSIHAVEFGNEKMLVGWIRKIAVNECLMLLRKNGKHVYTSSDETIVIDDSQDFLPNIEAKYLFKIIQSLPVGYRTIFNLYAIEGYSHKEISQQLGISEGTSKSQLNRGRALLKEKLKNMEE